MWFRGGAFANESLVTSGNPGLILSESCRMGKMPLAMEGWRMGIFRRLGVTAKQVEQLVQAVPRLRGVLIGYLAEGKLVNRWFKYYEPSRPDDHDRTMKWDRLITYKRHKVSIEVKSLQTNSVRETAPGQYKGRFQCDASDSRPVVLPDGSTVKTVCLVVGGFDLLAINLFEFGQQWHFAFVKNSDLPRTRSNKYTPNQQQHLLQTTPPITWPLQPPYRDEPFSLLDEIIDSRAH